MAEWEGFTEEELKRFSSNTQTSNSHKNVSRPKIVKPVSKKRTPVPAAAANKAKNSTARKQLSGGRSEPHEAALLSRSKTSPVQSESVTSPMNVTDKDVKSSGDKSDCIFDEETIQKKEKLKLEDVQLRQKQMEEKNRRKKDMLTKEIAERRKKAQAESSKLVKIQHELAKLDELLNFDVSILRDKIDEACMEFSVAQKRFNKAESEYIAAKMDLHKKTTQKEDLTEHLFNLIQVNEERKARKLEELMHKLDVEEAELEEKESENKRQEPEETQPVPIATDKQLTTTADLPPSPKTDVNADNLHGGTET